ncbi:RNA-directed DNA polymerase [Dechloromonas sp. CZR5]|uniref:RNA-directed DNA polymerase n=1 Tax=Dechloromonas sp. CZR5 TaxID=2608630 RepID=UPI00123D58D1|nr:RNA-directed DNA polymerase [Dechloromonas sp. CZR5]
MALHELLTDESLDFARRHLTAYYDSDFFPKPFEFECIWHRWDDFKAMDKTKLASNVPPLAIPWKKPRGGYRIVHQMDPLDAICYTAVARSLSIKIEEHRIPARENVACSYRISPDAKGFFVKGSGFSDYRIRCEELAKIYKYVLVTDISDFYNRIYLHRLGNALSMASTENAGKSVENFLLGINSKASQGIPVGPAASIVMSEAALIDVDQFIMNLNVDHVRYVDDIRIFSNTTLHLDNILQNLTLYLHQNHRLGLVSDKTKIIGSEEFIQSELNNQYQLEKLDILHEIEVINPYTFQVEDVIESVRTDIGERLTDAIQRILKFENLDLGVARAIIRRARAHRIPDIAEILMDNCDFFRPVINDVALYLDSIIDTCDPESLTKTIIHLENQRLLETPGTNEWFSWLISKHPHLAKDRNLRQVLHSNKRITYLARAAVCTRNLAWVREQKDSLFNYASWDRRAILYSAQIMSSDERNAWLKPLKNHATISQLEKWMIEWVLADTPDTPPLPEPQKLELDFDDEFEIPF